METVLKPFRMPLPSIGDEIIGHETLNNYDPKKARVGRVTAIYDEIVQAQLWPSGRVKESLRFIDDPGLAQNEQWRNNGAWDWGPLTKRFNALEKRIDYSERRLSQLERAVPPIDPNAKPYAIEDDPWSDYDLHDLRALAESSNVEFKKLSNRKTIIAKLRDAGIVSPPPVEAASR